MAGINDNERKKRKPQDAVVGTVKSLRAEVRVLQKQVKKINKMLGIK